MTGDIARIDGQTGARRPFRYFDFMMAAFVTILLLSNVIGAGKVALVNLPWIGPWPFGAGVLFFPVSYVLGDVLTEVYGYANARRCIWAGFAAMLFMALMATVVVALPPAADWGNQAAYEAVFGPPAPRHDRPRSATPRIGIFPGSRLASKNLPLELVTATVSAIEAAGCSATVELLEGERPDLERALPGANIVARDFGSMIAAVRACDGIISADSMPAHLAEMAGLPVFVFSPVGNRYWLPRSAFMADRWALFEEGAATRLKEFLDEMKA